MDSARLAKVWALTSSPNRGEAAVARERARVILAREGLTLADAPRVLRGGAGGQARPAADPWRHGRDAEKAPPPTPEPEVLHFTEDELRRIHASRIRRPISRWVWVPIATLYFGPIAFGVCRALWHLL